MSAKKVLVVDDDKDIRELLKYNLEKEGFKVETAVDGKDAIQKAKRFEPEVILLDIMMPEMDGIEACRNIRETPALSDVIIIFLTARGEEYTEIAAFEVGADDFLTKPIKPRALMSRVKAWLKRKKDRGTDENQPKEIVQIKDLIIDRTNYTVTKDEKSFNLPKKEFELLHFLARHKNKVYNRDALLNKIWGTDVYVMARTVDVHIRKIREKIGKDYIKTIKGVGYIFED